MIDVRTEATSTLTGADAALREDRIEDLNQAIETARREVLVACIHELSQLTAGAEPPLGVQDGAWKNTAAELKTLLDDAAASKEWERQNAAFLLAQKTYFQVAVAGLASVAAKKAKSKDSRKERFAAIAFELTAKLEKDPSEAALVYSERLAEVTAPDPEGVSAGAVGSQAAILPSVAGWLPLFLSLGESAVDAATRPGADAPQSAARQLSATIASYSWLVNVAVMIVAVSSGVKALWLDNLAWGGHGAWLMAFLWGAGVQTTGDAFTGLIGMRAKLGAPPGP